MAYGAAPAAGAYATAEAIKASGAIVRVEPNDSLSIINRTDKQLVVIARARWLRSNYQYLTAYKGLVFFRKSITALEFPSNAEIVTAREIWVPS
jgi:hypothetical protein